MVVGNFFMAAHRFGVTFAFGGDAVFGAFELRLERHEVLVGLEVGISFGDGQEFAQCCGEFALRVLEFLQRRLVEVLGVDVDRGSLCAGFDHGLECFAFVRGISFHGVHEVGDEVGAALVHVFNLSPLLVGVLTFLHQRVVVARGKRREGQHGHGHHHDVSEHFFHNFIKEGKDFLEAALHGSAGLCFVKGFCMAGTGVRFRRVCGALLCRDLLFHEFAEEVVEAYLFGKDGFQVID